MYLAARVKCVHGAVLRWRTLHVNLSTGADRRQAFPNYSNRDQIFQIPDCAVGNTFEAYRGVDRTPYTCQSSQLAP